MNTFFAFVNNTIGGWSSCASSRINIYADICTEIDSLLRTRLADRRAADLLPRSLVFIHEALRIRMCQFAFTWLKIIMTNEVFTLFSRFNFRPLHIAIRFWRIRLVAAYRIYDRPNRIFPPLSTW